MSLTRRSTLAAAIGALLARPCAWAQTWTRRPLRIVVGFQAGGTGDVITRLVGARLSPALEIAVVIENKPGSSGIIAANFVRTSDDDHTLLNVSETYVVSPLINRSARFSLLRDFKPIGIVAEGPQVILATKDAPFRTFDEFAKLARTTSAGLDYATSGFGHPQHLIGEYLVAKLHLKLVHVPTRGGAAAVNDLLAGTVKVAILGLGPTYRFIQDGTFVPLAVTTAKRVPSLVNVPTLMELGLHGFRAPQWLGFVAPRVLDDIHVDQISQQLEKALTDSVIHQRLDLMGFQPLFLNGPAMAARISDEERQWRAIITAANFVMR